jgi:hypothetical protein
MNVARLSLSMAALLLATIPSFAEDILGTWLRTPPLERAWSFKDRDGLRHPCFLRNPFCVDLSQSRFRP